MESPQTLSRRIKDYSMVLKLTQDNLTIQLRNNTVTYILLSVLQNTKLPSNFTNIFDTIQEIYEYIKNDKNNMISVIDNSQVLQIGVPSPTVKNKMLKVPLVQVPISKEELIEMDLKKQRAEIKRLQEKVGKLEKAIYDAVPESIQKILTSRLEIFQKKIQSQWEKGKRNNSPSGQSITAKKVQSIPPTIFPIMFAPKAQSQPLVKSPLFTFKPLVENKNIPLIEWKDTFKQKDTQTIKPLNNQSLDLEFKNSQPISQEFKQKKQIVTKAKYFDFDIDQTNKYLNYYIVRGKKITKKYDNGDELFQIYSSNEIPEEGRHQVIFQIDQITDNMIWVGFITENKKIERFIGDEKETISLGCNGGKDLTIDGVKSDIEVQQIRKDQLLTMQIEIKAKSVKFFKNISQTPFAVVTIPESMIGKRIYPFFQMVAKNDSITLVS